MVITRKAVRSLWPRVYAALDSTPDLKSDTGRGTAAGPTVFSGWTFHPSLIVALELWADGERIDRFFPHRSRRDVFLAHDQLPNAYYSGFERSYPAETLSLLREKGGELVAVAGDSLGRELRRPLWSWMPHRSGVEQGETGVLRTAFSPDLASEVRSLLQVPFQRLGFGRLSSEKALRLHFVSSSSVITPEEPLLREFAELFRGSHSSQYRLAAGRLLGGQLLAGECFLPDGVDLSPFVASYPNFSFRHFSTSQCWKEFCAELSHSGDFDDVILFSSQSLRLAPGTVEGMLSALTSSPGVDLVSVPSQREEAGWQKEEELLSLSTPPVVRGAQRFQELWVASAVRAGELGGERAVELPLVPKALYAHQPAFGVSLRGMPYERARSQFFSTSSRVAPNNREDGSSGEKRLVVFCTPYEDFAFDTPTGGRSPHTWMTLLARKLRGDETFFEKYEVVFLRRDDRLAASSLEGIPVLPLSEFALPVWSETGTSGERFRQPPLIVATDDWSVRHAFLLRYLQRTDFLSQCGTLRGEGPSLAEESARRFPELGLCHRWAARNRLPQISLEDLLSEQAFARPYAPPEVPRPSQNLSCIVPIYNSLASVLDCVRSLVRYVDADDEVILVNDCSDEETSRVLEELCLEFPTLKLVSRRENGGFVAACYSGLEAAAPNNDILLINSDLMLSSSTLRKMKDAVEQNPHCSLFSVLSTGSRKLQVNLTPGFSLEDLASRLAEKRTPSYPTVVTPEGQCLLIRRQALVELGFFDPAFGRGFSEESDLAMRYFLSGEEMRVVDNAVVFHEQSASFGEEQRLAALRKNRPLFEARWLQEYELAFHRFERDGEIGEIQAAFSFDRSTRGDTPLDVDQFLAEIEAAPTDLRGGDAPGEMPSWVVDAEVIFVLPHIVGSGGSLSILQHVAELQHRGIRAKLVYLGRNRLERHAMLVEPVHCTVDEFLALPWSQAHALKGVVASHWSTAYLVQALQERSAAIRGWYYVQDYEPWFVDQSHPHYQAAAKTYTFPLTKVAKTAFLCDTVRELHGEAVEKISPGLQRSVFYPSARVHGDSSSSELLKGEDRLFLPRFAAMYRPSSPRRGADRLITFFRHLLERCPEAEITLFGEEGELPSDCAGRIRVLGRLSQKEVAALYRSVHFVVDLSLFHGFGRMGLEGMACGAVPVLTESGGVSEYAVDGENCLTCDGEQVKEAVSRVLGVVADRSAYDALRRGALKTAAQYSEWRASSDWQSLLGLTDRCDGVTERFGRLFHPVGSSRESSPPLQRASLQRAPLPSGTVADQ
ncbi:glycosyltransferase [bacterium]|nr:glycosyltransferase [bacterium]